MSTGTRTGAEHEEKESAIETLGKTDAERVDRDPSRAIRAEIPLTHVIMRHAVHATAPVSGVRDQCFGRSLRHGRRRSATGAVKAPKTCKNTQ